MRFFISVLSSVWLLILSQFALAEEHAHPQQCTGFDTKVTCNQSTGLWEVELSNTAHPFFKPDEVMMSSPDGTVTVGQNANGWATLDGVNPGDTVILSVDAVQTNGTSTPGLDLCCTGLIEVQIPQGEQCTPPPPDRTLDVVKECGPLGYEDPFGSNTECTFTVNYSGPPPTPANPIEITDALTSGGPMVIQSSWPPSGPDSLWNCSTTPTSGPFSCTMDNTLDTDPTQGYWANYTSSFTVQTTLTDPYRNCLTGKTTTATGAPITDQSCTQKGDFDLVIEKKLAEGSICMPGETCQFEISVTNTGADPYVGDIALTDEVTVNGTSPAGTLTAITPAVCDPSLMGTTGCVAPVSLGAGQATTFVIDYLAPTIAGDEPVQGENCVALTDEGMAPTDNPETTPGKFACAEFVLEAPKLRIVKDFAVEECTPGGACPFTITIHNDATLAPYNGPVAIADNDTPGGLQIQSVTPNVCLPAPTVTPFNCEANVSVPAGGSQVLTFDAYMPFSAIGASAPNELENCASGAPLPAGTGDVAGWPADLFTTVEENCAKVFFCGFACHSPPELTEKLTMTKELLNPETCMPGGTCSYQITMTNSSTSPAVGPLTMEEHLPNGGVITAVNNLPWSCSPPIAGVATCAHPPSTLNPGDSTGFVIDVAIPAGFAEESIANCAGFHGDTSPLAQARAIAKAQPTGLTALFSRAGGYSQADLKAYLQIRGMDANAAEAKAGQYAPAARQSAAVAKGSRQMACAVKPLRDVERPRAEASFQIAKECSVATEAIGAPLLLECKITLSTTGLTEGDTIDFTDQMVVNAAGTTFSTQPWFDGDLGSYPCVHDNAAAQSICALPVTADMAAGQPLEIYGEIAIPKWDYGIKLDNCAEATVRSDAALTGQACDTVVIAKPTDVVVPRDDETDTDDIVPTPAAPVLTFAKAASSNACTVNRAAQTYTCGFDLTVSNTGAGFFNGPLVMNDTVTAGPTPSAVSQTGGAAGWSCLTGNSGGATCVNGALQLLPLARSTVGIEMTVPGQRDGGSLTNCVAPGVPQDPVQRIKLAQQAMLSAGYDVGRVDGAFGPRSRRALVALQQRLGLAQTGEISPELFVALGIPDASTAAPACVTVDLPPMPRPVVADCKAGQKRNSKGVCYTPEVNCPSGQVKNSRGVCYTPKPDEAACPRGQRKNSKGVCYTPEISCPQGQRKNSKGQCYTPRADCKAGQKRNSKGECYTPRPRCDPNSTVARGGRCVCRNKGMKQISPTRCIRIRIDRKPSDGVDGKAGTCVTIAGIRKCF